MDLKEAAVVNELVGNFSSELRLCQAKVFELETKLKGVSDILSKMRNEKAEAKVAELEKNMLSFDVLVQDYVEGNNSNLIRFLDEDDLSAHDFVRMLNV